MPPPTPARPDARCTLAAAALLGAAALAGCGQRADPSGPAATAFDALAAACTQFLAARQDVVARQPDGHWTRAGFSPAQVQAEVVHTESASTPFVGKLVIKDHTALAHAATEEEARALTLTPRDLQAQRTHTLAFRYDGSQWLWQSGLLLVKAPPNDDVTRALALDEVAAPGIHGFSGCLPVVKTVGMAKPRRRDASSLIAVRA